MKILQFGRSMIEMLGVLAIIGVLSIGGLLGYRRAVNNHQANVILDDVNRFAFVILERSGLVLDAEIDKGDFKESGIYNLKGYQSEEAQGFSITVQSVPKGVCEALLPKAVLEYKVGIVTAGGSVDDEVIYDTLNTDLCKDTNDIAFYFGDTSGVCNEPDGDGPCTQNSDCCGGQFCAFQNPISDTEQGEGECLKIKDTDFQIKTITVDDVQSTWIRSTTKMSWWSADAFCQSFEKRMATLSDINYKADEWPYSNVMATLRDIYEYKWYWLNSKTTHCDATSYQTTDSYGGLSCYGPSTKSNMFVLCR